MSCVEPWYMYLVNNISTLLIVLIVGGEGLLAFKFRKKIRNVFGKKEVDIEGSLNRDPSITTIAATHILEKSLK